jgi:hypothetical protein
MMSVMKEMMLHLTKFMIYELGYVTIGTQLQLDKQLLGKSLLHFYAVTLFFWFGNEGMVDAFLEAQHGGILSHFWLDREVCMVLMIPLSTSEGGSR